MPIINIVMKNFVTISIILLIILFFFI